MSLEEFEDNLTPRQKKYIQMQAIRDWGFGIFYLGMAFVLFFPETVGVATEFTQSGWAKGFAVLISAYGGFRIYRGIKKDYFIERD
jgi:tellurite resistance protein TehA-like permease